MSNLLLSLTKKNFIVLLLVLFFGVAENICGAIFFDFHSGQRIAITHKNIFIDENGLSLVPPDSVIIKSVVYKNDKSRFDAQKILDTLSLQEKIGQLIFPYIEGINASTSKSKKKRVDYLTEDLKVGGFLIFENSIKDVQALTKRLQSIAKIPLIFASDMEQGAGQKFYGTTLFPSAMAMGATRDSGLIYNVGKAIAEEALSLGIQQNYAPVADVNTHPNNPIINARAFSDNPFLCSLMSSSMIRGMQENGLIATSKHFPGHGGTNVDSHIDLPIIGTDKEKFFNIDLVPFINDIKSGVKSVMVGHLNVASYDKKNVPASLSFNVITKLLKEELGFTGLIVTDALNMQAISNRYGGKEAAKISFLAGADVLLFPASEDEAFQGILSAVKSGEISLERLNFSVLKILKLKEELNLKANQRKVEATGNLENQELALQVARKSITLAKDDNGLVPLKTGNAKKIFHLVLTDSRDSNSGDYFSSLLSESLKSISTSILNINSSKKEADKVFDLLQKYDIILISTYVSVRNFSGNISLSDIQAKLAEKIFNKNRNSILIAHGSPYVLSYFKSAGTYICNFSRVPVSERALAEALLGKNDISGKLPVTIPGTGCNLDAGLIRLVSKPDVKLSEEFADVSIGEGRNFAKLDSLLKSGVANKVYPAVAALIAKDGKIMYNKGFGKLTYDKNANLATDSTIYDLASVSKVVATTTAVMLCIDKGLFSLDDKVAKYIPQFSANRKENITIRNLLLHNSGLAPFKPFYRTCKNEEEVLAEIFSSKLDFVSGTKTSYSDLGMITMGKIVEKVSGKKLDVFCKENIFEKLGMTETYYNPSSELLPRIAPTEFDNLWRKKLIWGEVHDEAAAMLNGVAGHAGLFSTTKDIFKLLQVLLDNGTLPNGEKFISSSTVALFTKKQSEKSSRGLGWDTKTAGSSAGKYFSESSFGHTGFTGTSVWIDPEKKLIAILLSNRVNPTRDNGKIIDFRPVFHDAVVGIIGNL